MTDPHVSRLRELLTAAIAEIDAMQGAPPAPEERPDRWLDTAHAARIVECGYSTLYRWAAEYDVGFQTQTGAWKFSEAHILRPASSVPDELRGAVVSHFSKILDECLTPVAEQLHGGAP